MIVFQTNLLFVLLPILTLVRLVASETPRIVITSDLFLVEKASPLEHIEWREPYTTPVYCVSQSPVTRLEFVCPNCDSSVNQLLSQRTRDMTSNAGYPAIKLLDMKINSNEWRNADHLQCVGHYDVHRVTTDATVGIFYLRPPTLVTDNDHVPIVDSATRMNKFYFNENHPLALICKVDSNPPVENFRWTADGVALTEKGNALHMTRDFVGKTIVCQAHNKEVVLPMDSSPVSIETLHEPTSVHTNFDSFHRDGIVHPETNSVPIGTSLKLQCSVSGFPKPTIKWLFSNSKGRVTGVKCAQGPTTSDQRDSADSQNYLVTSDCTVNLDIFDSFGHYWCAGCIDYAQNLSTCTVNVDSLPKESIFLNVTGSPKLDQAFVPRVEQSSNLDKTTVYVPFCANPKPYENELYWLIDNERVNVGGRLENIGVQPVQKSLSHALCYEAPLIFDALQNKEKSKTFQLVVSNSQGQLNEIVPIGRYLVGNDSDGITSSVYTPASYDATGIGIGLAVFIIVLIAVCLCAYLWFKNKACFSSRKTKGKSAKYQSNLASTQLTAATNETSAEKPASNDAEKGQSEVGSEKAHLNGHHNESTYVKSYDDFDVIKETDEKEKMLPKNKEKYPRDSAV